MEMLPEIANRRSIRVYRPEPLADDVVKRILEAGRRAPSAKNRQTWRFIVVTDREKKGKLAEASFGQEQVDQAGAVFALCTTNVDYIMPNNQPSHPVDIGIASAFMMLQVEHEGLGSCPVTTFQEADVKVLLSVPHKMRVVMLLAVGVPGERGELTPRFPPERVVGYEHW
ncbi:nitroreductase [Alkalispirochaeta sphaeroplastigenens]|uniref:Nitroreductase n=1 Tax=Alkalispirochaeta sphaeroplastigenens TaxID=1187066 RepID=A0A2S4K0Y9_9SPIO|nr:nitroreductase family protein [Alkalispirochaeta sphaeroplastigenens]POR05434.1 nitroreductase [Alkalispirochaeta sphaeroplastigenens]